MTRTASGIGVCILAILLGGTMTVSGQTKASGTFDVKIVPQPADDHSDGGALGRMVVDKTYHGDFEGTAVGTMLTGMSPTEKTSGVYVALLRADEPINLTLTLEVSIEDGVMERFDQELERVALHAEIDQA